MTPEEYAIQQAVITAGLSVYVQRVARLFVVPSLTPSSWLEFLRAIFPEVQRRYTESAILGRKFYDSQRIEHRPDLPRNDMLLSELQWDWFVSNMEPARQMMSQPDSPSFAPSKVALHAVREVEMAGRRQVIGAVKNEAPSDAETGPEPVLQGWARVATGRETCAWCLMLISRGAEMNHKGNLAYRSAKTAGVNLDDTTAMDIFAEVGGDFKKFKEEIKDYIEEWHVGCDCVAVPVFDINNWPGRDQAHRALRLWIDAGKEASQLIESGESRSRNTNKETLNALRRRLERGDLSMIDYAAAA